MLKQNLDNNELIVSVQGSDASHLINFPSRSWSNDHFTYRWAQRTKHVKIKSHAHAVDNYEEIATKLFEDRENARM